jgi:hypothetical protein
MTSNFDLSLGSSDDKKIAANKPVAGNARIVTQQPRMKWIWFSVIELLQCLADEIKVVCLPHFLISLDLVNQS